MLVHISTPYEETFIRRNAVLKFLQRYYFVLRLIFQHPPLCSGPSRVSTTRLPWKSHGMYLRVLFFSLFPSETPVTSSSARCTTSTTTKRPVGLETRIDGAVLYPPLEPGDRVVRGPDWMWGNQDGNSEGTVIRRKEWKGMKDMGVGMARGFEIDHGALG